MKQTINEYEFMRAFETSDNYRYNFSYEGLKTLFSYLEDLEEEIQEEFDLDVIAFCCNYSEVSLEEFNDDYSTNYLTIGDVQENEMFLREIEGTDSFLIHN